MKTLSNKEYHALHDAIDFISTNSDGADEDKYPHDTLDGLRGIIEKVRESESKRHFNSMVKKEVKRLVKLKS
jgi:hypothetical protein